jgi:hypothetical protein
MRGAHADLLEEGHQAHILQAVAVGEDLAHVARVGEAAALGHAQEEPREPVGEIAADDEQVVVLEGVKELLGRQVLALQRADEFQHVLVGDDVGGRRGKAAEQVVDDGAREVVALDGQVGHAVGGVGDDLGVGRAAEAHGVDRLLEQRVEGHRDVEVEVGDLGELAQRGRRGEIGLAHDGAQPGVGFLAPTVVGEVGADDVVQQKRLRERGGVDAEAGGEFLGEPFQEEAGPGLGLHLEEFGADDGDDALLLDVVEQVFPDVVVQGGGGEGRGGGFGVHQGGVDRRERGENF